jgi:membrane peptidoglycan carboxypeptidase
VKGKLGPIRNAAGAGCVPTCTLIQATTASLNVPFFDLTLNLGPANVLEMARDAGIDYMWDNDNKRVDLREIKDMAEVVPANFSTELGIGQFAVTVSDHANGMATLAAGGRRADAHFVKTVEQNGKPVYSETIRQKGIGLSPQQIDDLNFTLSKVETGRFASSWDSAGKTGTWQKGTSTSQNSDVWTVGYTRALASAVWVGTKDGAALKTKGGSYRVFGASYAGPIWRQFMREAHEAMKFDSSKFQFGDFKGTGDQQPGGAIPSPTPKNPFDPCIIPGNPLCPPPGEGPGGGGPGGGGGGDGGGNGRPPVYETPPIIITRPPA